MSNSSFFDAYYYEHGCGRPYERDEGWLNFFDGIAKRIIDESEPKTVLDAGCALGFLVEAFRNHGVEAFGVDISKFAIENVYTDIKPYCWAGSVCEPFPQKYDLITSIEVLEHLAQPDSEKAIANFCAHTNEIVFSSTPFDYKESTHFNVQPPEYWAEQFARYGFYRDLESDMSFISPWAVKFVKINRSNPRLVREYERKFWYLWKENTDLRSLSAEMRQNLSDQAEQVRILRQQAEEKEHQVKEITSSKAWNIVLLFHRIRIFILPPNSHRDRFLRRLINFFSLKNIVRSRKLKDEMALVNSSGLFDKEWYLAHNPDIAQAKVEPLFHYLLYGGFEGRDPGPGFCSGWYLAVYEDAKNAGMNPLVHYLKYGRKEGRSERAVQMQVSSDPSDYDRWIAANEPSSSDLEIQRREALKLSYTPLISVVVPVWKTPKKILEQTISSVIQQTYQNWELCIADGASNSETKQVLLDWSQKDRRIKTKFLDENKGIAINSNEAIALAQGEFVGFLDHDDVLAPFALFEIVSRLQFDRDVDLVYSDEDKTDEEERRFDSFFKPDFSPDYLRSINYMPHFLVVRKSLGDQVAWFRESYDGAQDYDLILRLVEKARVIAHIPKILYHWRVWAASTAGGVETKPYANASGKKALQDHLERVGLSAQVEDGYSSTLYRVHYRSSNTPLISIIIPNHDHATNLKRCIDSILQKTIYPNFEIVLVENGSKEPETFKLYEQFERDSRVHIIKWNEPFNYSRVNNWAATQASGELFLFLDNDTEVINKDWLEQMLQFAIRPDVGAVGAKLYYPDKTIEHGGVIIGIGGVAGYSHRHFQKTDSGYFYQLVLPHNVSAVTSTCLMIRKQVFREVEGFYENYPLALGDVDLCLRILQKGYLNVWTPYAELYHYKPEILGVEYTIEKSKRFRKEIKNFKQTWAKFLQAGDPYYNPNLTLESENFNMNLPRFLEEQAVDLKLIESQDNNIVKRHDTGVILHLYYPDMWNDMLSYLLNLGKQFDLFVTIPYEVDISENTIRANFPDAQIYRCENRGRDVAPFLIVLSAISKLDYKYLCKVHTKKSPHIVNGTEWQQDMLRKLLGSQKIISQIKKAFDKHPDWGLIAPQGHVTPKNYFWRANSANVIKLAHSVGIPTDNIEFSFVAGSMFWFHPQVFDLLLKTGILTQDFDLEQGQQDGTLAHAFERFFGMTANYAGYKIAESNSQEVRLSEDSFQFRLLIQASQNQEQKLIAQVAEKEQAVAALSAQVTTLTAQVAMLTAQVAEKENQLNQIFNSKAWKIALLFRQIRAILAPHNSRRTRVLLRLINIIFAPFNKIKRNRAFKDDLALIRSSSLFDETWYLANNPNVAQAKIDPTLHYLRYGGFEGRDPGPYFNSSLYLSVYSDVKEIGINPLIHFIKFGEKEGRSGIPTHNPVGNNLNKKSSYKPKVTVIVPNYNHAVYLEKRLSSIYHQTYKNYEVILLDDCSSDQSRKILLDYQNRYPKITRCLFNESNSGSAFSQWKKGIENAEGELIWIAESDDFCDLDFLEKLVPLFSDETVLLSYAHSIFVDENGQRHVFSFEHYLSEIDQHKWDTSYVASAHNEVNSSLGLKNSIPNVSSVVFRRPKGNVPILNDPNWLKMKVCGDWLFYLNFIRGGRIAYCNETQNYYRIHQTSSSKKTHIQDIYYKEHETVACAIATLYDVPDDLLFKNYLLLENFYLNTVENGDIHYFKNLYNFDKIRQCKSKRTPNILMGVFAFSFGGGEIFPIRLANVLKEKGSSVIVINGNFEPVHPKVREMIYPQIPVLNYNPSMDLNAIVKEYGIEITHTHHASMDRLLSSVVNTKHVTTMHGMYEMMEDFLDNAGDFIGKIDHWFYTANKNIIPFKKNKVYDPGRFTKIDNGMRIPEIHQVDLDQFGITSNSFTVCLASRARYDKGWFEAIDSIAIARESTKKDIHLLLIGEGPVYESLKNTAPPDYIHLLGYKSNLVDYFAVSQVGFLPTYFKGESFPLVMIECFMAEKPIIASKIGEIHDMIAIDDQRIGGALIELQEGKVKSDELASALIKMINDEQYYQECVNTVKLLKNKFDLDKIAGKYLDVYMKLCNQMARY